MYSAYSIDCRYCTVQSMSTVQYRRAASFNLLYSTRAGHHPAMMASSLTYVDCNDMVADSRRWSEGSELFGRGPDTLSLTGSSVTD